MRKHRNIPSLSAGSMADIAFLLLIFFLVATTIATDQGIKVTLAPFNEKNLSTSTKESKKILINGNDRLMIDRMPVVVEDLSSILSEYLSNEFLQGRLPIIAIQNERNTSYSAYIAVYDQIELAYRSLWETIANKKFKKELEKLSKIERQSITRNYPKIIREFEVIT